MNILKLYPGSEGSVPPAADPAGPRPAYRIHRLIPDAAPAAHPLSDERRALLRQRLNSGFYFEPENFRVITRCLARDLAAIEA